MDAMGITRISRGVITIAERLHLNKASIDKIKKLSKDNVLPRIIVDVGAVSDTGKELFIATDAANGKETLVFSVYMSFDMLEQFVNGQLSFGPD